MEHLVALHKHWLVADAVKEVVNVKIGGDHGLPEEVAEMAERLSSFSRLSVFYGLIYVVIEGYKEMKYQDDDIDALLGNEEFVGTLRLFRNSTFHYQKQPIPEKARKFIESEGSETWIKEVHLAFKRFFERNLPIHEMLQRFNP
ncbi:hypothetical protein [Marinobacter algicola]|uniref:hypothetical protein n=1 Tax=Marinobacter algicola TaxID=236100 RepID=UPI003BA97AF9